jgi:hypothetical protein
VQGVYEGQYNNARTNAQADEPYLSPATVTQSTFGRLNTLPVDGQARARHRWPLTVMVCANLQRRAVE